MARRLSGETVKADGNSIAVSASTNASRARTQAKSVGKALVKKGELKRVALDSRPAPPLQRDSYTATALEEVFNRSFHASMSRITHGLSPAALA